MQSRQPKKESASVHAIASVAASAVEITTFHPVDTGVKRLQVNNTPIYNSALSFSSNRENVRNVIFRDAANQAALQKATTLYKGFGWAAVYKVCQRGYKFTAQPVLESQMKTHFGHHYFGAHSPWLMAGISGSMVGVGEVVLLPLDILKIRAQAGKTAATPQKPYSNLYAGLGVTSMRNGAGSFALFGTPEFLLHNVYRVDKKQATLAQKISSEMSGSAASIAISSPLDVIKTRMQAKDATSISESAFQTAKNIIKHEGVSAFYKGIGPKLLGQGIKLTAFLRLKNMIVDTITQEKKTKTPLTHGASTQPFGLFKPASVQTTPSTSSIQESDLPKVNGRPHCS